MRTIRLFRPAQVGRTDRADQRRGLPALLDQLRRLPGRDHAGLQRSEYLRRRSSAHAQATGCHQRRVGHQRAGDRPKLGPDVDQAVAPASLPRRQHVRRDPALGRPQFHRTLLPQRRPRQSRRHLDAQYGRCDSRSQGVLDRARQRQTDSPDALRRIGKVPLWRLLGARPYRRHRSADRLPQVRPLPIDLHGGALRRQHPRANTADIARPTAWWLRSSRWLS